jgi:SAM-dependent methyltransferase
MLLRFSREHYADAAPRLLVAAAELLLDALPPLQPQSRFLEVAAGPGHLARPLMDRIAGLGALVATEADPSLAMHLPVVRGRAARVLAAPDRLPFAAGSFDVAIGNLLLGDPAEDHARLAELRRVLRPGGWLLVTALLSGSFDELLDVVTEACEAEGLPQATAALVEARRALPDGDAVAQALRDAELEVAHIGVEERALFFPDGAAAFADPLVQNVLVPSWLGELPPLPPAAWEAAARAADTYFGGRLAVRVRTAVVTGRADRPKR